MPAPPRSPLPSCGSAAQPARRRRTGRSPAAAPHGSFNAFGGGATGHYDLLLTIAGTGDSIRLLDQLHTDRPRAETLKFSDGSTIDLTAGIDMHGSAGNDAIYGSDFADTIAGGAGKDTLTGRLGADAFVFLAPSDSLPGANRDVVADFNIAQGDVIDLSAIDASDLIPGDQAFAFIGTNLFSGAKGEVRYTASGGNTIIEGSVSGGNTVDFQIQLNGTFVLTDTSFRL